MLLKNTGEKIVNVGRDILMPGEEKKYPDGMIGKGALSALVAMGFLKVSMEDEGEAAKAQAPAEPPVIVPETIVAYPQAEEPQHEGPKKASRSRSPKKPE